MYINQNKILFSRKGTCLLANVAGTSRSIAVSDIDIIILECVAKLGNNNDFLNHDEAAKKQIILDSAQSHAMMRASYADINPFHINKRIDAITQAGGIIENPSSNPLNISPLTIDTEQHCQHAVSKDESLRLSTHFAASMGEHGFYLWSSKFDSFFALNSQELISILAFGEGNTFSQILPSVLKLGLSEEQASNILSFAKNAGLLTPLKLQIQNTEQVLTPFSTSTSSAIAGSKHWQELKKEDKIPVYFVPHMENHFPLALGVLYSALINYQEGKLCQQFQFIPLNYLAPKQLFNGPYRKFGPGVWLFSNYMWSIDINMEISRVVKQHNARNFTIHGGPSTPDYQQACEDFLNEHKSVDVAVHGEGEVTITEIFECISKREKAILQTDQTRLATVSGLTYREEVTGRFIRTGSRERMKEPDAVPSPYLSGLFDAYQGRVEAAIIETNRGCPYGCTFCDWGSATNQKIRKFDLQRVKDEITWIGKNKVRVMWIADANYGLYDRDIEISQFIVDTKNQYGFPQEIVVNYTKNSTWRLVEIIKIFSQGGIIGQGIISIQTTDEKTLEVINRKNIRTQRYDELAQAFTDLNLPLSTDLMIGLPGMTVDSFKADLQRYIDMDVSVKAYPTQLLPNSPMAEPSYMEKYKIKTDEHSFLRSTYSYTEQDRELMMALYQVYVMADGFSLLRYILRYLQWDHNIQAMDFLAKLLRDCTKTPNEYPLITWSLRFFNNDKSMPGGWSVFYQQVKAYIVSHYEILDESGLNTALLVNQASMPDDAISYPRTIMLEHNFVQYFKQNDGERLALNTFPPSSMQVSDPNRLSTVDLDAAQYDTHQYFWELHSPVARPKSLAEFAA